MAVLCQQISVGRVTVHSQLALSPRPIKIMKITIKTLQQKVFHVSLLSYHSSVVYVHLPSFQVEADPSESILQLKEKIEADQGHPVGSQKIIYSGISTFIT